MVFTLKSESFEVAPRGGRLRSSSASSAPGEADDFGDFFYVFCVKIDGFLGEHTL